MGTINRYTPEFKADAVAKYNSRRAGNPGESKAKSSQVVAFEMGIPDSTLAGWVRGAAENRRDDASEPLPFKDEHEKTTRRERTRMWDVLAFLVSVVALLLPVLGIQPLRDRQEQEKNAQSYFEALTKPNPASYGALSTRYAAALNYTEQDSPAARLLTLLSEASRVEQRVNASIKTTKGSTVTRVDGDYTACATENPTDCKRYNAVDFDERNRLRSYSLEDVRIESMLLNRDEGSSQNGDWKVNLIEGAEYGNQVLFVAQVTNQHADKVATIAFASAQFAAGGQRVPAEVEGPSTLGPNESVTIAGVVNHARGVTLSLEIAFQDESGQDPKRTSDLLIKLF